MMMTELDSSLLLATVAGAVVLACVVHFAFGFKSQKNAPPSAPLGMWETMKAMSGSEAPFYLLKAARMMQKKHDAKVFQIPVPLPGGVYVVADAKLQKQVLNDRLADKPTAIYGKFATPGYPEGIFTRLTQDPQWKVTRKCAAQSFSKNEVDRMNAVCRKHVDEWVKESLHPMIASGASFDPSKEMTRVTFSTIFEAGFEYETTRDDYDSYTHNINVFLKEFGFRQIANPLRRPFGWFFEEYRAAMKTAHDNVAFCAKVLQHYKENKNKSTSNTLIKLLTNNETICSKKDLIYSEMLTFVAAGFDTTGYTLSSTLVLLARHPEIAAKLRAEQAKVESGEVSDYLRCVMKESRRLLPVAAMGPSRQFARSVQLGGYTLPANAILLMPQMASHRDALVFGPDPDAFRPERWLDATPEMNESVVSFAFGSRNCVGQALAYAEMDTVLPRLLSEYEFSEEVEGKLDYFLTLKFTGTRLTAKQVTA